MEQLKQDIENKIENLDYKLITLARKIFPSFSRIALFIVYFWFGILKIFQISPASGLVQNLLNSVNENILFSNFIIIFALYEIVIAFCFLIPALNRLSIFLLVPHMIMTILPLIFLPEIAWQSAFIPTLEGQYIIKNIVIIALAIGIMSYIHPYKDKTNV